MYDTLEEFYLAEALEYIDAWRQSTADNPAGICGPIGPTEQLPLVARLVNDLDLDVRSAHFWGMDEWVDDDGPAGADHASAELRQGRHGAVLQPHPAASCGCRDAHLHFPTGDLAAYSRQLRPGPLRGDAGRAGRGEALGLQRSAASARAATRTHPPPPAEYRKLTTRVTDLHPMTIIQNARTSGGGQVALVPTKAATVGPVETWKAEKVSIWQAGMPRQPLRHAADHADDLQADPRRVGADVAVGRSSQRAVQLLPARHRHGGGKCTDSPRTNRSIFIRRGAPLYPQRRRFFSLP